MGDSASNERHQQKWSDGTTDKFGELRKHAILLPNAGIGEVNIVE